jgi:hypothetical protein
MLYHLSLNRKNGTYKITQTGKTLQCRPDDKDFESLISTNSLKDIIQSSYFFSSFVFSIRMLLHNKTEEQYYYFIKFYFPDMLLHINNPANTHIF